MHINARKHSTFGVFVTSLIVTLSSTAAASAQPVEAVTYYHLDAAGSIRMLTDANGQVVERHDYMPFGEEWPSSSSPEGRLYVGKERDQETGFDYSGARYYLPGSGRFNSPDPVTADALRIVDPQRWNRYSYAVNNPLTHGDPDGLDVVVLNYMSGAGGNGHVGIMAVDPTNGSASYGGFNPAHDGWWNKFYDTHGTVAPANFPAGTIRYEKGRPTQQSLANVAAAVAAAEKQGKGAIRAVFFKTSDAQTAALREFIKRTAAKPPSYNVTGYNCQVFCILGLRAAGINAPAPSQLYQAEPNVYFALTLSELAWRLGSTQQPHVETSYCFNSEKGCAP